LHFEKRDNIIYQKNSLQFVYRNEGSHTKWRSTVESGDGTRSYKSMMIEMFSSSSFFFSIYLMQFNKKCCLFSENMERKKIG